MQRRNKQKKSVRRSQRFADDGQRSIPNSSLSVPRGIFTFPDRLVTKLKFYGLTSLSFAIADSNHSLRYRPSAAFDVDPSLASTATPGFAEYASIYASYRTVNSRIVVRGNQSGVNSMSLIVVPLNQDPGGSPAFATVASWVSNSYGKSHQLPSTGSPSIVIARSMSTEKIYGSKMVLFDDNFSSLVSTIPANNWFWAIGVICSPVAVAASLVSLEISIEMNVEFFDRKVLIS